MASTATLIASFRRRLRQKTLGWWYWLATLPLLITAVAGGERDLFPPLIAFTLWQAAHFRLRSGALVAPPVQTRIGYTLLLVAGLWSPLAFVHWIQVAGTTAMVVAGYCPLARFLSLMPWNRGEPFTLELVRRTVLASPSTWRFVRPDLQPRAGHAAAIR